MSAFQSILKRIHRVLTVQRTFLSLSLERTNDIRSSKPRTTCLGKCSLHILSIRVPRLPSDTAPQTCAPELFPISLPVHQNQTLTFVQNKLGRNDRGGVVKGYTWVKGAAPNFYTVGWNGTQDEIKVKGLRGTLNDTSLESVKHQAQFHPCGKPRMR